MIVTDSQEQLVQIPQNRNAGSIFKASILCHVAQRSFLNRILLQLHPIVDVDAEIAYKNIEGDVRFRRDENGVRDVARMIKVKGGSDAKIKAEGVELGDCPDRVEAQARGNDKI